MKGGGRRAEGEGASGWLLFSSSLLMAGCGLLNFGGGPSAAGAHTVFLAPDGCATFLARTLGRDFLLADAAEGAYTPSVGDVLAGPTRVGRSVFALYPTGAAEAGAPSGPPAANVPLDVRAVGLPLAEARARLDAACRPSL